jgi:hypothetical protein
MPRAIHLDAAHHRHALCIEHLVRTRVRVRVRVRVRIRVRRRRRRRLRVGVRDRDGVSTCPLARYVSYCLVISSIIW